MDIAERYQEILATAQCLYSAVQVEEAIAQMAQRITARIGGENPVICSILTGGIVLTGKLITQLPFALELDYLHVSRYRNRTEGGELYWKAKPTIDFKGRTVLLVDDILDEGVTLQAAVDYCEQAEAASILTAVLVDKRHQRKHGLTTADFIGLETEDRYLFGYGLDYHGYFRNMPGIYGL